MKQYELNQALADLQPPDAMTIPEMFDQVPPADIEINPFIEPAASGDGISVDLPHDGLGGTEVIRGSW